MRALTLTGIGGLEHLEVRDVPAPALRTEDEVLIRVRCAALNRIDLWMTGGLPNVKPVFPHVVGSDGAGEVEAVGPAVRGWRPGDRVLINPGISCGHCAVHRACPEPAPSCRRASSRGSPEKITLLRISCANAALMFSSRVPGMGTIGTTGAINCATG